MAECDDSSDYLPSAVLTLARYNLAGELDDVIQTYAEPGEGSRIKTEALELKDDSYFKAFLWERDSMRPLRPAMLYAKTNT